MKLSQLAVAFAVICCVGVAHAANYDLWEDETVPVSYQLDDGPKMESRFLRVYTMPNCPPCEAWKRDVWPRLQAKGWEEGRNVEFVMVAENAPRFEWVTDRGVESVSNGYRGRDSFNAWHQAAVEGGVKAIQSNGCQCGPDCPCVARAAYSGPRERVPNPNFVMTELVEPSAVFTEYDEPQGILDGGVQSYQSAPVMGNCANGQCGPMQMSPAQQQQGYWTPPQQLHQSHGMRSGPVRRVLGGLFGGCR